MDNKELNTVEQVQNELVNEEEDVPAGKISFVKWKVIKTKLFCRENDFGPIAYGQNVTVLAKEEEKAGQLNLKGWDFSKAKSGCKKCYGTGSIGRDPDSKCPLVCNCVVKKEMKEAEAILA